MVCWSLPKLTGVFFAKTGGPAYILQPKVRRASRTLRIPHATCAGMSLAPQKEKPACAGFQILATEGFISLLKNINS